MTYAVLVLCPSEADAAALVARALGVPGVTRAEQATAAPELVGVYAEAPSRDARRQFRLRADGLTAAGYRVVYMGTLEAVDRLELARRQLLEVPS